jgi:tetrahydromethanopterin S-methyltransferase subunit G
MQESGFVKESELRKLEKRVEELEAKVKRLISFSHNRIVALCRLRL